MSRLPAALILLLICPRLAVAQAPAEVPEEAPAEVPEEAPAPGPRLPSLIRASPAVAPPDLLLPDATETRVELRLGVSATGEVTGVELVAPGQEALDRAAVQAAWNLYFSPGLDALGQAAPSVVGYVYVLSPAAPVAATVAGITRAAEDGSALPSVEILLEREGSPPWRALSDGSGAFALAGPEPGTWRLRVTRAGREPLSQEVEILPGQALELELALGAELGREQGGSETVIVEDRRGTPQVTQRVVPIEQLRVLPGSGGDAIKAVQNLPGVARAPFGIGQLIIRGTGPEDSAFYLDGARIPLVFHFGGLSTVLNSDVLEQVVYLPGGYGVRYGRTLGGVIDLQTDPDLPEEDSGYVSVDLYQSTAFIERRLGEDTSFSLSGRRSYIDVILDPVLDRLGAGAVRAPRYWDLQARVQRRLPGGTLEALALASDDRFTISGDEEQADEIAIGLYINFQKAMLRWDQDWGDRWHTETTFLVGPETQKIAVFGGEVRESPFHVVLREEATRTPEEGGRVLWRLGADLYAVRERYVYDLEDFGLTLDATAWTVSPSPYAEAGVQLGALSLTPGLRLDPWFMQGYKTFSADPRLGARWEPGPATVLKGSLGRYSQFAAVEQVLEELGGDPTLGPEHAVQATLGGERTLSPTLSVDMTGFYYKLYDLVKRDRTEGIASEGQRNNAGLGRVYGVEGLLRLTTDQTFGWLAVTWSRSLRADAAGEPYVLFDYDQPLVVTALASRELNERWRLGARLRYGSGNPYTPVIGRTLDLDSGGYDAIFGDENSDRLPAYWTLDVRVDRDVQLRRWKLTTYLDLQNATNHKNVEVMSWTWDYTAQQPITGLPILPVFGLQGSW